MKLSAIFVSLLKYKFSEATAVKGRALGQEEASPPNLNGAFQGEGCLAMSDPKTKRRKTWRGYFGSLVLTSVFVEASI